MRRRSGLVAVLAVLTLAGCGGGGGDAGAEESAAGGAATAAGGETAAGVVEVADFSFPAETTVTAGSEVTFTNSDTAAHQVRADDGSFETEPFAGGESATLTAPATAGEYGYVCALHPSMTGTLVVQ